MVLLWSIPSNHRQGNRFDSVADSVHFQYNSCSTHFDMHNRLLGECRDRRSCAIATHCNNKKLFSTIKAYASYRQRSRDDFLVIGTIRIQFKSLVFCHSTIGWFYGQFGSHYDDGWKNASPFSCHSTCDGQLASGHAAHLLKYNWNSISPCKSVEAFLGGAKRFTKPITSKQSRW